MCIANSKTATKNKHMKEQLVETKNREKMESSKKNSKKKEGKENKKKDTTIEIK